MSAVDRLITGRAYPQSNGAALNFQNASTTYAATNSARYVAASTNAANLPTGEVRFVEVTNDHATAILYVELGDADTAPSTAVAGAGERVFPSSTRTFGFQGGGNKVIAVISSVDESTGQIHWKP
ncbi:MAG TPA: hypothetical protein VEA69_16700 [Tepidisphaeraceae bacterium]|nr:hypothetical protein [Tepidisphaeraceae bacterium]